jgi:hypothetical protein
MDTDLLDAAVDSLGEQDSVIDEVPTLSLDLDDNVITKNLNDRVQDSKDYWNSKKGYNLDAVRKQNVAWHLGDHYKGITLYKHQIPYLENEIFVGIEAIISYVCSRTPESETAPGSDSVGSKVLATDLASYHKAHSQKFGLARIMEGAVRNMLLKRVGIIGLRFDPSYGAHGEIIPEIIDPDHVVFDKTARLGENPRFIRINREASTEELLARWPEKEKDILKELGIQRQTLKQLSQINAYHEVWFTDYSTGKPVEAVAWYIGGLCLEKSKDPNWFEDKSQNFLDQPVKPFVMFNFINDGSKMIDQTTPVEQAGPLQDLLNKRGRQIMENADHANPKEIYAGGAITKDDAENITSDVDQKIILADTVTDIRQVVMQIQGQMLPNYVIQDKTDIRNTLHAILGTPPQFSGTGDSEHETLGQDLMQKNQASARQDQIVRAVEASMDKYFNLLTQMMKVYYDEAHDVAIDGGDGQYDFISMHSNKIEKEASVSVRAGTSLPFDKQREQAVALQLAQQDKIAPYDLYTMLDMPNPQKLYDNWMKYKTDPTSLSSEIDKDMANRSAYIEFIEIMDGKKVEPPDDVTPDHLMAHTKQLSSDQYTKAKTKYQRALIELVTKENESLKRRSEAEQMMEASIQQDTAPIAPPQPPMPPMGGMPQPGMGMPPQPSMMPPQMGQPQMPMAPPPPVGIGQVMGGTPIQPQPQVGNPVALPGV